MQLDTCMQPDGRDVYSRTFRTSVPVRTLVLRLALNCLMKFGMRCTPTRVSDYMLNVTLPSCDAMTYFCLSMLMPYMCDALALVSHS